MEDTAGADAKMEREIDREMCAWSAVMQALYQTIVVKSELSQRAKLFDLPVNLRYNPHPWF